MRCFAVVRGPHSSNKVANRGSIFSQTGRLRPLLTRRFGSGSPRYLRTVFRLTPIWRATWRMDNPSTKTLCLITYA